MTVRGTPLPVFSFILLVGGTLLSIATLPAFIVLMETGVMPLVRPF